MSQWTIVSLSAARWHFSRLVVKLNYMFLRSLTFCLIHSETWFHGPLKEINKRNIISSFNWFNKNKANSTQLRPKPLAMGDRRLFSQCAKCGSESPRFCQATHRAILDSHSPPIDPRAANASCHCENRTFMGWWLFLVTVYASAPRN